MAKIQRTRQRRGLSRAAALIEDTSRRSPGYLNVSQLGDELALGKNGFRVQGAQALDPGSRVEIEITDSRGGVIYHEVRRYTEDVSRVVGVFVYQDTPPGPATVTVLAKARQYADRRPIPEAWQDKLNVKWQRQVNVNINSYNTDLIRFERTPQLLVTSERYTRKRPVLAGALSSFEAVGAYIPPVDLIEGIDVDLDFEDYDAWPLHSADVDTATPTVSTTLFPPNQYGYEYLVLESDDFDFTREMEERQVVISADVLPLSQDLVGRITDVINADTARYRLTTEAYRGLLYKLRLAGVEEFSIIYRRRPVEYEEAGEARVDSLQLGFLKTIVGEAVRARVYRRVTGGNDSYSLVGDFEIEPTEVLTDTRPGRNTLVRPAGRFRAQEDVDRYLSLTTAPETAPLGYDDATLAGSAVLSATTTGREVHGFGFNLEFLSITFFEYSEYTLSFQVVFEADRGMETSLDAVLTGDAFSGRKDVVSTTETGGARYVERTVEANFFPTSTARASGAADSQGAPVELLFNAHVDPERTDWAWYVRDISLTPAQEAGFSPDYAVVRTELNPDDFESSDIDRLQYKVDVFDIDNNKAGVQIVSD